MKPVKLPLTPGTTAETVVSPTPGPSQYKSFPLYCQSHVQDHLNVFRYDPAGSGQVTTDQGRIDARQITQFTF